MADSPKRYFEVTRIYAVDETQVRKILAVARGLCLDRRSLEEGETDDEVVEVIGEDFLDGEGRPDVTSAIMEVPSPDLIVGAELIEMTGRELGDEEIAALGLEEDEEDEGGDDAPDGQAEEDGEPEEADEDEWEDGGEEDAPPEAEPLGSGEAENRAAAQPAR